MQLPKAAAILLAAGSGERLGADRPKAFVALGGRPIFEWSLEALLAADAVTEVIVAVPEGELAPAGTVTVIGGETRSQSVKNALAAVSDGVEIVVVHDAARPLVTARLVNDCVNELIARGCDGVVAAAKVTDTIKRADENGLVVETPTRSELWAVQTPQVFKRDALLRALQRPDVEVDAASDDASLVEVDGGSVAIFENTEPNTKITEPLDLRQVERILPYGNPSL